MRVQIKVKCIRNWLNYVFLFDFSRRCFFFLSLSFLPCSSNKFHIRERRNGKNIHQKHTHTNWHSRFKLLFCLSFRFVDSVSVQIRSDCFYFIWKYFRLLADFLIRTWCYCCFSIFVSFFQFIFCFFLSFSFCLLFHLSSARVDC